MRVKLLGYNRIVQLLQSFYAYHTYFTIVMALLIGFLCYVNEMDHARLTVMEAFFLGVSTSTDTGLLTFDFSITKISTQIIVMIGAELCGVFFASTLVPSVCRWYRLKQIIKQQELLNSDSTNTLVDFSSSESSETTDETNDETNLQVFTSEIEPMRYDYKLEIKSLEYFIYILLFYTISFKLIGFIVILITCYTSNETINFLNQQQINPIWFSLFQTISSWNNLGMTVNQNSLNPLINVHCIVITSVFLNMTGNIMIPIITRMLTFIVHRLFEQKSKHCSKPQPLLYILKAPTRMSLSFFSSTQTKLLFLVQLFLILLQTIFFSLFYNKNDLSPLYVGFVNSSFTRTAGFSIINVRDLSPPVILTYILSMYIAAYPTVILRQYRDIEVNAKAGLIHIQSNITTILKYVKSLFFSHIIWFYTATLIVMAFYCSAHTTGANQLIDVMFEISSAFGTVGMSLGSSKDPCSFSGDVPIPAQLIICLVMILGRHRGFPTHSYPLDYYSFWKKVNS
ncbi:high-affinity potassium uptake transporter, putative [Entamoeba histolytica HM-1:IMSS-B]|nr:highaffinity potassium uptake transporter, putative [Entamoeba histolytica KU27]EMH73269.1 high-affinity potassium uptake transporter, putative [Entamoeba histolytica HM-1:IMSS-B]EMS13143.1 high-affinity potassium uptake transporter, putative [Entamoeba histolytica HM-3:IMSS]ENY66053.1 high-affinity potassium uptake transporter, putative [Entamoeba histolytica HM-1:IMSS-A]GAT91884.1 high-affinity potassium uptake transporter putative [Entamoeba histolytica]